MLADRVKETTTTTGTGNLTLAGAATNFRTFNTAFSTSRNFFYSIIDDTNNVWECGIGHLSASTTLVRDVIVSNSSGTTSALNLSAGTKDVICAPVAASMEHSMFQSDLPNQVSAHVTSNDSDTLALTALRCYYVPFLVKGIHQGLSGLGVRVTASAASSIIRLGIYSVNHDPGTNSAVLGAGDLLAEGTGSIDSSTTGAKTVTLDSTLNLTPGWYWLGIISDGTPTVRAGIQDDATNCPMLGVSGQGDIRTMCYTTEGGATAMPTSFIDGTVDQENFPKLWTTA